MLLRCEPQPEWITVGARRWLIWRDETGKQLHAALSPLASSERNGTLLERCPRKAERIVLENGVYYWECDNDVQENTA